MTARNKTKKDDTTLKMNIQVARALGESLKTSLGPKGMDKMLIDPYRLGKSVVITDDGATILTKMDIEHPVARMMVEISKNQDIAVGDGTTSSVILAGEMLKNALKLIDQGVHSTVIAKGYHNAAREALALVEGMAIDISRDGDDLKRVALTAMSGKESDDNLSMLADMVIKAVKQTTDEQGKVDGDKVHLVPKSLGLVKDSEYLDGILLDLGPKNRPKPTMITSVKNARIALLNVNLSKINKSVNDLDPTLNIKDPESMKKFKDSEIEVLKNRIDRVIETGANVILTQRAVDEELENYISKKSILMAKRFDKKVMLKISLITGATIINDLSVLTEKDLGTVEKVERLKMGEKTCLIIRGCKDSKTSTIILKGGTDHVVEEMARVVYDGIRAVERAILDGKAVSGGGAIEVELSQKLKKMALKVQGRDQLAFMKFAEALEVIPKSIAQNAGIDPIDAMINLKAAHESGNHDHSYNLYTREIESARDNGILDSLKVKTHVISSALEITNMILRIDDVIGTD